MSILAIATVVLLANVLVLMFMAGAKRMSYTPAEQAAEDELQYAWVCAQVNGRDREPPMSGSSLCA